VDVKPVPGIDRALLFKPVPHVDERGFFCRTFDAEVARAAGIAPDFAQDSLSRSASGVVRGLHVRRGEGEAKLVRCSYGAVFDVIVDLRPASPTYLNWESFELRDSEQVSLYVPAGCAHGFQALTDPADVSYRIDRPHDPAEDVSVAYDDPDLAIRWPLPVTARSERDQLAPRLAIAVRLLTGGEAKGPTLTADPRTDPAHPGVAKTPSASPGEPQVRAPDPYPARRNFGLERQAGH
jgi:dTDP-4-dehydrorhamnose 3,5-epimerase